MRRFCSRARDAVQLGEVAEVVERGEPVVQPPVAAEDVPDPAAYRAGRGHVVANTRAVPEVGSSRVLSILIVVVLPAPLGPSRPNSSRGATSKVTPRTASVSVRRGFGHPVLLV